MLDGKINNVDVGYEIQDTPQLSGQVERLGYIDFSKDLLSLVVGENYILVAGNCEYKIEVTDVANGGENCQVKHATAKVEI